MITALKLPKPAQLRPLMQSLATLDAINSPEWELRHYSFDSHWDEGEEVGSIRNGSGDDVFMLFRTYELAAAINAHVDYSQLVIDLAEIGYPADC